MANSMLIPSNYFIMFILHLKYSLRAKYHNTFEIVLILFVIIVITFSISIFTLEKQIILDTSIIVNFLIKSK